MVTITFLTLKICDDKISDIFQRLYEKGLVLFCFIYIGNFGNPNHTEKNAEFCL